jgi:drug/metabolite transporter (DMT)-like permease
VLVMLVPYFDSSTPANETRLMGAGFGLLGAVCAGFATIETRKLTQTENTGAIVAYFMTLTTLVGLLSIFAGWVAPQLMWKWPNFWDAILLITMGVTGGIGQITLTQSFRHADASLIAPFDYISMVWAILVGWLLFGELPKAIVVLGSSVVVAAGIFVIWREHRLGLDRSQQKASSPTRAL